MLDCVELEESITLLVMSGCPQFQVPQSTHCVPLSPCTAQRLYIIFSDNKCLEPCVTSRSLLVRGLFMCRKLRENTPMATPSDHLDSLQHSDYSPPIFGHAIVQIHTCLHKYHFLQFNWKNAHLFAFKPVK